MTHRSILILPEESGKRLDVVIASAVASTSRAAVARAIHEGHVQVFASNGRERRVRPGLTVAPGDRVEVRLPTARDPSPHLVPESVPLDIVYQDDDLLVVNKPSGMPVHPGAGRPTGTLVHALLGHTSHLSHGSSPERPGIVHRLDKDTSGLLIVARSDDMHRRVAAQIAARAVHRTYRTLVWGVLRRETGRIDAPIGRDPRHRQRMAIVERGRSAVTHYRLASRGSVSADLVVDLETGRTHQIRVHLSSLGHPVVGDAVYGGRERALARFAGTRRDLARRLLDAAPRQLLHAWRLSFAHPRSGEALEFEAPLPSDYAGALEVAHG